jgi:hypothetical protein
MDFIAGRDNKKLNIIHVDVGLPLLFLNQSYRLYVSFRGCFKLIRLRSSNTFHFPRFFRLNTANIELRTLYHIIMIRYEIVALKLLRNIIKALHKLMEFLLGYA